MPATNAIKIDVPAIAIESRMIANNDTQNLSVTSRQIRGESGFHERTLIEQNSSVKAEIHATADYSLGLVPEA